MREFICLEKEDMREEKITTEKKEIKRKNGKGKTGTKQ